MAQYTPMMQQYLKIKADQQDAFLFFRLGDFYEMFFEDAIQASKELEITLTSRDGGSSDRIPMCGVPYHSAENYIKQLVEKGYKVAICEQVEDPKAAKGVVKREVVQLITPGTVMEGSMLEEKENNYVAALSSFDDGSYVVSYNDLTTGENSAALVTGGFDAALSELYNRPVKEVVVASDFDAAHQSVLSDRLGYTVSHQDDASISPPFRQLVEGVREEKLIFGFGRLLNYIQHTQKRALDHLQPLQIIELKQYMTLDMYSKRNLELLETIRKQGKAGSLLSVVDKTITSMGARMLKKWMERPLLSADAIADRHDQVEGFLDQFIERETLRDELTNVYDLERLAGRVAYGNVNARDLIQLRNSLQKIPDILSTLSRFTHGSIHRLYEKIDPLKDLRHLLEESIAEDPPIAVKEGGIIRSGFHEQLDAYRDASKNGKQWIAELEQRERKESGIKSLKIGYNRVFGYYIEVTKANLKFLPEGKYERKQTLTNAERFITPELKEKETMILEAQEKSVELEYELFLKIRDEVKFYVQKLQHLAEQISRIDVLQGFAQVAESSQYVRPTYRQERIVDIREGRHPVVEQVMKDSTFVPNDIYMDEETDVLLITGPNMSGKSTYMRQLALTAIMGQMGCFVPCSSAVMPIFDQIFTRIGAADDLVSGHSTFMVEMLEANHAISHATENSMILLDEIGRGTSTYDGMALAQAIVEYIHHDIKAKTLFSTHYHELTSLENPLKRLKNVHVRAEEYEGNVIFLHQIKEGPADESYGIHVAKLANLPEPLIGRATELLHQLENGSHTEEPSSVEAAASLEEEQQLSLFVEETKQKEEKKKSSSVIEKRLKALDLMEMTPMEAMNELYSLQKELKK
ncbi:DNA mismatch repair protein MutS [Halobacillus sp. ACCC02827]|uniref:DNA mismatch repair protein MutS n=1 Tax=unclassified Halobacillus TaxID=2636472 RepID=UPI0002A5194E|nr:MULTISPECIES: DNA mismatch repair protein MutS [unclassified Halobacillus]ELK44500.1 DNA mismatch repair protein MutS [Halobacillus sp. BAB-2008]WJE17545.1 DNA mismatch repair protein MutS [Halobacillus sp. ACCC02827]